MATTRKHVVIIGGGFGGLNVARAVAGADVDVTIVDRTNHHLFQPLLYQVATGILPEGLIAPPIRRVVQSLPNIKVVLAEVQDVDLDRNVATALTPNQSTVELPYDFLVVAAGSTHSYFGKDQWGEFAPGMKTVDDARYQRDAILSKFEMAELATDPQERAEWLTFVVIGAGPTGVELAGQIAELAHQVLPKDYSKADTRGARIILLEGAPAVLPPFKPKLQQYTKNALEKMGVEIKLSTLAVDMDHESVTVKGPDGVETIRARSRIWAAGVQASPLAKMLAEKSGAETDRPGRIVVGPDCSLPGHPEVFAIGDMANVGGLPGVAQPAMQEGKYVGKLIKARIHGDTQVVPAFKYFDKGSMATIGHKYAVADAFGRTFTGILAYLMWGFIHVLYLIGWGNRIGTLYTWLRALYVSKNRGHRVITFEQAQYRIEEGTNPGRPSHYLSSLRKSGEAPVAALPEQVPSVTEQAQK
jgi:NADH dehydrogenase